MRALQAAARAMEASSTEDSGPPSGASVVPGSLTLAEAARRLKIREPEKEVLFIVDQMEELVTMASGGEPQKRFFAALDDARAAGLRLVYTLRSDFEPHFFDVLRDNPAARFPVRPMNRAELREVIEGPARDRVLDFDPPSLVDELIDEVLDSPGALPLLSFTLSELYRDRVARDAVEDRSLTKTAYEALGGVTGALGTRADTIYDSQPDKASKETMDRVLLRLVSLEGGEAAKRRLPRRELVSTDPDETTRAARIVQALSEARLVIEGREEHGGAPAGQEDAGVYVEAAHDKLVTGWKRLWEILGEHREDLPLLRSCTTAAEEWEANGRDADRLWNADPRLPQLQALQKRDPLRFNAQETRFLEQSLGRKRRRLLGAVVILAVVIAGLSATSLIAVVARRTAIEERNLAREEKLHAEASEASAKEASRRTVHNRLIAEAGRLDKDVTQEQALLLSVEAAMRGEEFATDAAMRAVQDRSAKTVRILRDASGLRASNLAWAQASSGRPPIIAAGVGSSLVLWNPDTGAELSRIQQHNEIEGVMFSPSAERILIHTGWWHEWVVFGAAGDAWKEQGSGILSGKIQDIEWSPDSKLALVVDTKEAIVWSAGRADVARIQVSNFEITEGHFLPGGKEVLLCGTSKEDHLGHVAIYKIAVSERERGRPARVLVNFADPIDHCAVSPDGKWYAVSTRAGSFLWDGDRSPPRSLLGGVGAVLRFDHKSKYLAAGTAMGEVALWSVRIESDSTRLEGHTAGVNSVQWSHDDEELLTSSADRTAILWNTRWSTKVATLSGHDKPITDASWDPTDNPRVATASEDGTVRVFAYGLSDLPVFQNVEDATYDPSGQHLAVADRSGVVTLRSTATSKEVGRFGGESDVIRAVRYCPGGEILVTRDEKGRVTLWAAGSGERLRDLEGKADLDATPSCSLDGRFIAAYDKHKAVLWDVTSGARTEESYGKDLKDPIWHPRKNVVAMRVWATRDQVRLFGPELAAGPRLLAGNVDGVYDVAWSHDGARLVSGDNGKHGGKNGWLHLYENVLERTSRKDDEPTEDIEQKGNDKTYSLAWSPDDAYLVAGGQDAGRVFETKTWTVKSTLAAPELTKVVWTPLRVKSGRVTSAAKSRTAPLARICRSSRSLRIHSPRSDGVGAWRPIAPSQTPAPGGNSDQILVLFGTLFGCRNGYSRSARG